MKRLLLALALTVLAIPLVACTPNDRILPDTMVGITTWDEVDAATLSTMVADGADFILVVSSEDCSSCQEFHPILDAFVTATGIVVHKVEAGSGFPTTNAILAYTYTPTIAVFSKGTLLARIDPVESSRPFASLEGFTDWIDAYVVLPE